VVYISERYGHEVSAILALNQFFPYGGQEPYGETKFGTCANWILPLDIHAPVFNPLEVRRQAGGSKYTVLNHIDSY
jgi:hypothetical protein